MGRGPITALLTQLVETVDSELIRVTSGLWIALACGKLARELCTVSRVGWQCSPMHVSWPRPRRLGGRRREQNSLSWLVYISL